MDEVVQLSRWYQGFGDDAARFDEDMEWSLAYFEKNTKPALYSCVYGDMLQFNKEAHGGPLFFKLLSNETSTTKESNRRVMIRIIKTYKIKISWKREVISDVVDLFCAITDTISAIHDDCLPEDYVQQIITIFTTTSVPDFNQLFEKLKTDLISMELQGSLNMPMLSTGVHL